MKRDLPPSRLLAAILCAASEPWSLGFFANESGNLMRLCAQTAANVIDVVVFTARSFTDSAREWQLLQASSGLRPNAPAPAETSEVPSQTGVLRCAAEATARALELAVGSTISLQLLGVGTIKAFDAILVVVSLQSRVSDHEQRVVGTAVIESQSSRAAVNAVLSATNRLLGNNTIFLR